jgi:hypothetical protein
MLRKGMLGGQNPVFINLLEHPFFISERIQRIIQASSVFDVVHVVRQTLPQGIKQVKSGTDQDAQK